MTKAEEDDVVVTRAIEGGLVDEEIITYTSYSADSPQEQDAFASVSKKISSLLGRPYYFGRSTSGCAAWMAFLQREPAAIR
jgi:hypothetical protein